VVSRTIVLTVMNMTIFAFFIWDAGLGSHVTIPGCSKPGRAYLNSRAAESRPSDWWRP
jgi:hypothetical protein